MAPLSNLLFLSLSLLALLPSSIATPAPATPTVTATAGKIIGRSSLVDPSVHAYLGIPFAKSPTGSRRFSPPVRLPKQTSPISAKEFSVACINQPLAALAESPFGFKVPEGEDCLSVNIWTKPGRNNAPVLIFFYGGGFLFGASSWGLYEGTYFAAHNDAVVVSFNYRLNVFGFPNSPGVKTENLGILDQRMALEWIRDNIGAFGGDPSKMTMFGHSAGAASVDLHTFAWPKDPIVKGLIPQSGSVGLLPLLSGGDRYDRWGNLTEKVGCADAGSHKNVLECMRKVPSEKIVEGMKELEPCGNQLLPPFGPRVDGKVIFSPEEYQRRGEKGLFAKLPMLTGSTDNEVPAGTNIIPGCAPEAPHGVLTAEQEAKISTAITFTCPAKESAGYRLHHKVPIWRYRYYGNFTLNSTVVPDLGASHGSELSVIFGTAHQFGNLPDKEKAIVKYLQSAWTAFAKSPSSGLSSDPFNLPLYKERTLNLEEPTLLRLAYGDEAVPSLTWPEEEDWICAFVANGGVDKEKRDGGLILKAGLNGLRGGSWRL